MITLQELIRVLDTDAVCHLLLLIYIYMDEVLWEWDKETIQGIYVGHRVYAKKIFMLIIRLYCQNLQMNCKETPTNEQNM